MALTLVIMAAGKGSRFGGNKPLADAGPSGQSLFEYSIYDAVKAGFNHIVFVVSPGQRTAEYSNRLAHYNNTLKIDFAVQDLTTGVKPDFDNPLVDSREKPWGTGHAVLACQDKIENPFVVINADDYYGRFNFKLVADYLLENTHDQKLCTLTGYSLRNTLSDSGGVNRGVCSTDSHGYLTSIHEVKNIRRSEDNSLHADPVDASISVSDDSIVSMTFWGFQPSIFKLLELEFQSFLSETNDLINDEYYIPEVVNQSIQSKELRAHLIPTNEIWKGVTYASDLKQLREYILQLTHAGFYPATMHRQ